MSLKLWINACFLQYPLVSAELSEAALVDPQPEAQTPERSTPPPEVSSSSMSKIELDGHTARNLAINRDQNLLAALCPDSRKLFLLDPQTGTILDRVNNLQQNLAIQEDESVRAQADVAFGLIRIYRALGGGWQLRCWRTMPKKQSAVNGKDLAR